ncbi:Pimeloyl-ACP methyl ester carboxylesterase [Lysobacter sp. yr284]|nr:Pimeloyl-ACP methyl ester carboxylesterase [Lysobacter sp. yr284]
MRTAIDGFPALRAWRDAGEFILVRGRRIYCRRAGAGPRLLLIHGFPTSSLDWAPMWPMLTSRFEVLAFDLLGLGFSAKPRGHGYRVREQADLAEAVAHHYGWDAAFVLAHDYGDTVAQELLARSGQGDANAALRIVRLCLLNGGLFPETHRARLIQRLLASPLGPGLVGLMSRRSFARSLNALFSPTRPLGEAGVDEYWALLQHEQGLHAVPSLLGYMAERRRERSRWVGALQTARMPVRLVCGALDPVSGLHMCERYRELVPHADVVVLDDVGHFPQLEDPQRVFAAAADFFLDDGAPARG